MGFKSFVKRLFGWAVGGVKFVFAHSEIDEFAAKYADDILAIIVGLAARRELTSAEKRTEAFVAIKALAFKAGVDLRDHLISFLVELFVAKAKGTIRPA
jgi:hypothetical protein